MWQVNSPSSTLPWADAPGYCTGLNLAGYTDWTVPDLDALRSLVEGCPATETGGACTVTDACASSACPDSACQGCAANGGPADGCYCWGALGETCGPYWSATPVTDVAGSAWYVDFSSAQVDYNMETAAYGVRCTRLPAADDDDDDDDDDDACALVDNGDGTANDPCSGLMWQIAAPEDLSGWSAAESYCAGLNLGGHADWSVPTIDELRSAIRGCAATQSGGACGVTDACLDHSCQGSDMCAGCVSDAGPDGGCYWPTPLGGPCTWFWSSSPLPGDPTTVWGAYFLTAAVDTSLVTTLSAVRCVRQADDDDDSSPVDDD